MVDQRNVLTRSTTTLVLAAFVFWAGPAQGQKNPLNLGQPADQALGLSAVAEQDRLELPLVEVPNLFQLDQDRKQLGLPPVFAIPHNVDLSPANSGSWEMKGDLAIWRLRVQSADALSLNFGMTEFELPASAVLSLYNEDRSELIRFTSEDNNSAKQLWTPVLRGEDTTIQLVVRREEKSRVQLRITSVNHDFRGFGQETINADKSGSCNVDVVCSQGDQWRKQIRSVAVMARNGRTFCTGAMVNNTANDGRPFFLTANHCGVNANNAAGLVAYWNYENTTCRNPGSSDSGRSGNGRKTQFLTGSTFRAGSTQSDFTLVEFNQRPKLEFNVFYAGWDARPQTPLTTTAIHHPSTDEKRISFDFDRSNITGYLGRAGDTHIEVADWDVGTTEPGSSGSPLFDQNQRIVGQLHGGWAACGNDRQDYYGRIHKSWTGGGTDSTSLKAWLDHSNSGQVFTDGYESRAFMRTATAGTSAEKRTATNP